MWINMLYNSLASEEQLIETPSRAHHVDRELEYKLRAQSCRVIQQAGVLLRLPQRTLAVAQVLFQRFWFVSSLHDFSAKDIAMGALFLSTKLEETPVRLRHLINAFDYTLQRLQTEAKPFIFQTRGLHDQKFYDMKEALVVAEMQILKRLGFNVHVILPYAMMVNYLQVLGLTDAAASAPARSTDRDSEIRAPRRKQSFAQRAWSLLNDSLQTPVLCLFPPQNIACAAIYLASKTSKPPTTLPMSPTPWWLLFDATKPEMLAVCSHLSWVYQSQTSDHQDLAPLMDRHGIRTYIAARQKPS